MIRIGCDLVHIPHLATKLSRHDFLNKVFHPSEQTDMRPEHLAGIYAAKEAYFKASQHTPSWKDIEIITNHNGAPHVRHNNAGESVHLSISHDNDYALAFVIITHENTT